MKKLILTGLLASVSTVAMAGNGLYVQGSIGASKLEAKPEGEKFKDSGVGYAIAVGKDTGAVRYQADYTNFGKIKKSGSEGERGQVGYDEWAFTIKAQSLGLSAIYDFDVAEGLTPYAGVRVGINQLKVDHRDNTAEDQSGTVVMVSKSESVKKTSVGAGVLAGVQYALSPQLSLDAGLEYNRLGKVDDAKVNQYGAKVGLRYNF